MIHRKEKFELYGSLIVCLLNRTEAWKMQHYLNKDLTLKVKHFCIELSLLTKRDIYLLNPTGHVMYQQFNIQQLYALPTLYLCVLYLSENKQRLVPLTA